MESKAKALLNISLVGGWRGKGTQVLWDLKKDPPTPCWISKENIEWLLKRHDHEMNQWPLKQKISLSQSVSLSSSPTISIVFFFTRFSFSVGGFYILHVEILASRHLNSLQREGERHDETSKYFRLRNSTNLLTLEKVLGLPRQQLSASPLQWCFESSHPGKRSVNCLVELWIDWEGWKPAIYSYCHYLEYHGLEWSINIRRTILREL